MRRIIFTLLFTVIVFASLHAQEKPKAIETPKATVTATREQSLEVQLSLSQIETAKAKAESFRAQAALLEQQAGQIEATITPKLKSIAETLKIPFEQYEAKMDQGNLVFVKKDTQAKK